MQAIDIAPTDAHSPYDVLRPMRCLHEFEGRKCTGRASDINWSRPGGPYSFRCPKCRSYNLVLIAEAGQS